MPVVSLNLTEQAYRAYIQVPRGRRSQVFSAIIEKRDLKLMMRGSGILEDLGSSMGPILTEQLLTPMTIYNFDAQVPAFILPSPEDDNESNV